MTSILWGDLETYSETPIKHGTYKYAQNCEIMLFTYAFDDGPVHCWDLTKVKAIPEGLKFALSDSKVLLNFSNAMFDRSVMGFSRHGYYSMLHASCYITRWRDTMIKGLAHALPGSLDKMGEILGIKDDEKKHKEGRALVQLFCKPRPKNSVLRRATSTTHPEEWQRFIAYAKADVEAMRAVDKKLPKWNYGPEELALWHLDQTINDRGVLIDLGFAHAAVETAEKAKTGLAVQTVEMTNGEVEKTTQRDKLLLHILAEYGVDLPDLQSSTLERRIEDPDIPQELKDLLHVRLQASMGSSSKYKAMINAANTDGRCRGLLQYNGASRTRRHAGRTVQPQNMFRPPKYIQKQWEFAIAAIKSGSADLFFDNVMEAVAATARGAIIAPEGKKLVVSDLSNIEGRDQCWLAGEKWKLQAFRDFDNGTGHDLYKIAYAKSFRVNPESVNDDQRQKGKVMELALGYGGGVGAFLTFALAYGIDLEEMAEDAYSYLPPTELDEAKGFLDWTRKQRRATFGLSDRAFVTCDAFKRLWRKAHPEISSLWGQIEGAVRSAINNPGTTYPCRMFKVRRDGAWLRIGLPSGRCLCYPSPQVAENDQISYFGVNQYTRQWQRIKSYGGKFWENCIAKDTLVLTYFGFVKIQDVRATDWVWDGDVWVPQDGAIYKGKSFVLESFGVNMTPDHLVLTTEGWKNASSCERYNRADCRLPEGYQIPRDGRGEVLVGRGMPVWQDSSTGSHRVSKAIEERNKSVVRLYAEGFDWSSYHQARNVTAPRLRSVEGDDRSLPAAFTPRLAQLWRAGYSSLRFVGRVFRELLGRYGWRLQKRSDSGTHGQREGVLPTQLPVGVEKASSQQYPKQRVAGHSGRSDDTNTSGEALRSEKDNIKLPATSRLESVESIRSVYDLKNCGPRSRFTVLGDDGQLLIVHNCCQALAGDIMKSNMQSIEDHNYEIIFSVHDEIITEVPDSKEFSHEQLSALLATPPKWALDIPLAAGGYESYRYRKG